MYLFCVLSVRQCVSTVHKRSCVNDSGAGNKGRRRCLQKWSDSLGLKR